jgi:AAA domain
MNQMHDPRDMFGVTGHGPFVEFFGLPGSGKTTIARDVHAILARSAPGFIYAPQVLRDEAGTVARVAAKLRLILSDSVRNGFVNESVRCAFALRQPSLQDRLRAAFRVATVVSLYDSPALRQHGAVVDQGLLQALWSVRLRLPDDDCDMLTAALLKTAVAEGRHYVSVETPHEVCAERLAARLSKHSRMQQAWAVGNAEMWMRAEFLQRDILSDFRAASRNQGTRPRLIVVDGTAHPADVAGQIVAAFLKPDATLYPLRAASDNVSETVLC